MNLTASDRKALVRLAASLPKGSEERRTILSGLKVKVAATRKQKEDAVAGKFPPDSKMGRGANRSVMLTGQTARVLGQDQYATVKLSELSDADLEKLYELLVS